MECSHIEKNKEALEKFKETYPNIRDAFYNKTDAAINYLRLLGFSCAACGGHITTGNLKYNNYLPDTKCYKCQGIKFNN